jgi:hypothetical protein
LLGTQGYHLAEASTVIIMNAIPVPSGTFERHDSVMEDLWEMPGFKDVMLLNRKKTHIRECPLRSAVTRAQLNRSANQADSTEPVKNVACYNHPRGHLTDIGK